MGRKGEGRWVEARSAVASAMVECLRFSGIGVLAVKVEIVIVSVFWRLQIVMAGLTLRLYVLF